MANRQSWLVEYLSEAVVEVQGLSKKDLLGVLNAVDKLRQLGSQLAPPHMKPLQGEPDLLELRPRQGQSPMRVIYARIGDGFKILAVASTHDEIDAAASLARRRAELYDIDLGS
jgi:hypothetical protein